MESRNFANSCLPYDQFTRISSTYVSYLISLFPIAVKNFSSRSSMNKFPIPGLIATSVGVPSTNMCFLMHCCVNSVTYFETYYVYNTSIVSYIGIFVNSDLMPKLTSKTSRFSFAYLKKNIFLCLNLITKIVLKAKLKNTFRKMHKSF